VLLLLLLLPPVACVCRMVVNNDFEVQFNETKRLKAGMSLPPYRYNVTAKPRCGCYCSELSPQQSPRSPKVHQLYMQITDAAPVGFTLRAEPWCKQ
jgi:hypothetical protein